MASKRRSSRRPSWPVWSASPWAIAGSEATTLYDDGGDAAGTLPGGWRAAVRGGVAAVVDHLLATGDEQERRAGGDEFHPRGGAEVEPRAGRAIRLRGEGDVAELGVGREHDRDPLGHAQAQLVGSPEAALERGQHCSGAQLERRALADAIGVLDELDPFGKIPEFKFCAVRVERASPTDLDRSAAE